MARCQSRVTWDRWGYEVSPVWELSFVREYNSVIWEWSQKIEFSDSNLRLEPLLMFRLNAWHFDWMLQSLSGYHDDAFSRNVSKIISNIKLASENSIFHLHRSQLRSYHLEWSHLGLGMWPGMVWEWGWSNLGMRSESECCLPPRWLWQDYRPAPPRRWAEGGTHCLHTCTGPVLSSAHSLEMINHSKSP